MCLEITVTNNERGYIIKLMKYLENREISLKKTNEKTNSHKGKLLRKLFDPLIKVGLTLMRNVLTPLVKSVLLPLRLTIAASATNAAVQKKIYG